MPLGRITASRSNQSGFRPTIQLALLPWPWVFVQSSLDTIGHKALADPFDTGSANIQCRHNLLVGESFIRFEQDHRPLELARLDFAFAGHLKQRLPFFIS
jgi:hypothetical protein